MELLEPVSPEQERLLKVIGDVYAQRAQWPVWQYVDETLRRSGLNGRAILDSLPVVGDSSPHALRYGLVWFNRHSLVRDEVVRLTVAGTYFVPELAAYGNLFIDVLQFLAELRNNAPLEPTEVTEVRVHRRHIARRLTSIDRRDLELLPDILRVEPPTMGASYGREADGEWHHDLTSDLLDYCDVSSVPEYVARVSKLHAAAAPVISKATASPLDLAANLGYFDAVWRLHFQKPIVQLFNAERVTRLAFGASNVDEFSSQISSLAELLKNLQVPGSSQDGKTPLARLKMRLKDVLDDAGFGRASDAITMLECIAAIRNSLQHVGTEHHGSEAFKRLGIDYPVFDWSAAWETARAAVADALIVLREELQFVEQA